MEIRLSAADGSSIDLEARSIGGGEVVITSIDGRPVLFDGSAFEVLVEALPAAEPRAAILDEDERPRRARMTAATPAGSRSSPAASPRSGRGRVSPPHPDRRLEPSAVFARLFRRQGAGPFFVRARK